MTVSFPSMAALLNVEYIAIFLYDSTSAILSQLSARLTSIWERFGSNAGGQTAIRLNTLRDFNASQPGSKLHQHGRRPFWIFGVLKKSVLARLYRCLFKGRRAKDKKLSDVITGHFHRLKCDVTFYRLYFFPSQFCHSETQIISGITGSPRLAFPTVLPIYPSHISYHI